MFSATGYEGFSNAETFTLYSYINDNPTLKEVINHSIQDFFYNCADDEDKTLEDNLLIRQRIEDIVSRALTKADVVSFLDIECKRKVPINYNVSPLEQSLFQMSWLRIDWEDIVESLVHL